jgi:hypothetical protein
VGRPWGVGGGQMNSGGMGSGRGVAEGWTSAVAGGAAREAVTVGAGEGVTGDGDGVGEARAVAVPVGTRASPPTAGPISGATLELSKGVALAVGTITAGVGRGTRVGGRTRTLVAVESAAGRAAVGTAVGSGFGCPKKLQDSNKIPVSNQPMATGRPASSGRSRIR